MLNMIANELSVQASLLAQTVSGESATAHKGTGIDIGESAGPILVLVNAPVASASDTITFTVEHSHTTTDGDFTAVGADALVDPSTGDADTFTQVTDAVAVMETLALKRDRLRRYVRVVATTAGTSISGTFAAYLLFNKKYAS